MTTPDPAPIDDETVASLRWYAERVVSGAVYHHALDLGRARAMLALLARLGRAEAERDALRERAEKAEAALGVDLAGRPFAELLDAAADALRERGGGPMEDCLRRKAEDVRDALREKGA